MKLFKQRKNAVKGRPVLEMYRDEIGNNWLCHSKTSEGVEITISGGDNNFTLILTAYEMEMIADMIPKQ